jgi:tetratricopeptide (TPR) repeat protein
VAGKLDIDVDEGWFSAELTAAPAPVSPEEAAPVRLPDTLGGQMPEADWARVVETLRSYEREVAALVNPRRRAALCYEIGRIYETRLGDDRRAVSAYQRAHRADPFHLPTLRAGRGVFSRAGRWPMVLSLLDAELRADPNPVRRARLLVEKGDVYLRCDEPDSGRACYEAALELAPDNRAALRALAQQAAATGTRAASRSSWSVRRPRAAMRRSSCGSCAMRRPCASDARPSDEHAVALLEAARAARSGRLRSARTARPRAPSGRTLGGAGLLLESAPHRFEASMSRAERMTETARLIADQLGDNRPRRRAPGAGPGGRSLVPTGARTARRASRTRRPSGGGRQHAAAAVRRDAGRRGARTTAVTESPNCNLKRLDDEEGAIASLARLLESAAQRGHGARVARAACWRVGVSGRGCCRSTPGSCSHRRAAGAGQQAVQDG